jgi:SAM-dependent methyltransferase
LGAPGLHSLQFLGVRSGIHDKSVSMSRVQQAYDRCALTYDLVFAGAEIRSEIWSIADRYCIPGTRLLDLGCGTGDDAIHFARRGLHVTAIDISPAMIEQLKLKCGGTIQCHVADMQTFCSREERFDGIFSNFSALNYVSDLRWLRRVNLTPGSHVVFTTLGRFYPLGSAISILKGKPRLALRRLSKSCLVVREDITFNVHYHSVRTIQDALGPDFELKAVKGLRALRPIPKFQHLQRFLVVRLLQPLDRWLCSHRLTAVCADQFISVWRYSGTGRSA